ncbi:hypothetical protein PoB_003341400 [Plakobranchus ocellatus]|uniref:Uncharacterized protein n=1 Tax=Plakobranchus ocellatus TaxID=259542 RepID=A0AAV4AKJ0_9GAST|nr:hypothetical protein PoB_003341400 [Plakobranchus ocellatus]
MTDLDLETRPCRQFHVNRTLAALIERGIEKPEHIDADQIKTFTPIYPETWIWTVVDTGKRLCPPCDPGFIPGMENQTPHSTTRRQQRQISARALIIKRRNGYPIHLRVLSQISLPRALFI